jgi:hypothetical protein
MPRPSRPKPKRRRQSKVNAADLFSEFQQLLAAMPCPEAEPPPGLEDDLIAWSQYYLPHHFRQPPSAMHREVATILDSDWWSGRPVSPQDQESMSSGAQPNNAIPEGSQPLTPGREAHPE